MFIALSDDASISAAPLFPLQRYFRGIVVSAATLYPLQHIFVAALFPLD